MPDPESGASEAIVLDKPVTRATYREFRMALLDRNDQVMLDVPVMASCGTGCWGKFDVTLTYHVATAQWATLRVWDISEASGTPSNVREYPVYLRPAP